MTEPAVTHRGVNARRRGADCPGMLLTPPAPSLQRVVATDAHEGPVHVAAEGALYLHG
jgi:hypothetical protein